MFTLTVGLDDGSNKRMNIKLNLLMFNIRIYISLNLLAIAMGFEPTKAHKR
jgi:hypothetical protein